LPNSQQIKSPPEPQIVQFSSQSDASDADTSADGKGSLAFTEREGFLLMMGEIQIATHRNVLNFTAQRPRADALTFGAKRALPRALAPPQN